MNSHTVQQDRSPVTEDELQRSAAKKEGERVTLREVEGAIVHEAYFTAGEGCEGGYGPSVAYPPSLDLLTICVLTLWNGFTVTGQSACADPKNYDVSIGRRLARADAVNKIWPLMGYELRSRMARDQRLLGGALVDPQEGYQTYIGTKVVNAKPMTRATYNAMRDWELPADENGFDDGYLVEYTDRIENPPHVEGFKGYVSWSPKEVFERAYRPVSLQGEQP